MIFNKGRVWNVMTILLGCCFTFQQAVAQDLEKIGKKKEGPKINGGVSLNNVLRYTDAPNASYDAYSYYLTGNVSFSMYGISVPVSFSYSNRQFSYQQPFNQLGFSPRYKWITVHGGYRSMSFSPYTLNGYTFLGGGLELKPKSPWEFSAMGGRLNRKVEYDSSNTNALPAYLRWGTGAKLKLKIKEDYLAITGFYATDVVNSLSKPLDNLGINPVQNSVWSAEGSKVLFKKLKLSGEFASSSITRDIRRDGDFDNNKGFNMLFVNKKNSTTAIFKAYKANLSYTFKVVNVGLGYEHVDPGYTTLGAYYFNNDLESYTANLGTSLMKSKLTLAWRGGLQRNNLDNAKMSEMKRWVNSVSIGLNPTQRLNMNISYSDFQNYTNIRPAFQKITTVNQYDNLDTLNYVQITRAVNFSASLNTSKSNERPSAVSFSASAQGTDEKRGAGRNVAPGTKIYNGSLGYSKVLGKDGLQMSLFGSANMSDSPLTQQLYIGPGVNFSKPFFDKKLKANLGANYNNTYSDGSATGSVYNLSLGANVSPKKGHNLSLSGVYVNRNSTSPGVIPVNDVSGTVGYSYSF